jgi:hypothetical protein
MQSPHDPQLRAEIARSKGVNGQTLQRARNGALMVVLGLALRSSGLAMKLFDSSSGLGS